MNYSRAELMSCLVVELVSNLGLALPGIKRKW